MTCELCFTCTYASQSPLPSPVLFACEVLTSAPPRCRPGTMPTTDTSDSSFDDDIDYDVYSLWSKKELRREGMIDLIRSAGRVSKSAKKLDDKLSTQKSSISRHQLEAYTVEVGRILVQRVGKLNQQVKKKADKLMKD